jgi:hypothetical protein
MRLLQSAPAPSLSNADFTLAETGRAYAVYVRAARAISVNLSASSQQFVVRWLNPRTGQWHNGGTVAGGAMRSIGAPPFGDDAAALVVRANDLSGSGFCTSAASCNDNNPCTSDVCGTNGLCSSQPVANGTSCGSGDSCSGAGACQNGVCVTGAPIPCTDNNPCTTESCGAQGCIHTPVANGTSCADATVCNGAETCQAGVCMAGTPPSCNDGNACTTDSCDAAAGCRHVAQSCDDANPCTTDGCSPQGCTHVNNTAPCNDGLFCTVNDACSGGTCAGGGARNCADAFVCTADACNETSNACTHAPNNGVCNDADACTTDVCSVQAGCTHTDTCGGGTAVAVDPATIKTACGATAGDTLTIPSVTVSALADRILVVTVGAKEDNADCNMAHPAMSVTYAGQPLELGAAALSDTSGFRACTGVFYLLDPPAGTANVAITFPATLGTPVDNRLAGAAVLYNAAQQAPEVAAAAGADATTNPITTGIGTFTDGALIVDAVTQGAPGTFTATESGQTTRWQLACGGSALATSTKPTPSSGAVFLGWSHSAPKRYAHALAAFAPAGSPTTTLPPQCTTNAQCNDGNPCTTDTCSAGTCRHTGTCAARIQIDGPSIKSACSTAPGNTISIPNVTVNALAERVLVVAVGAEENDADCDTAHPAMAVRYGNASLMRAVSTVSNASSWRACNGIFYLLDPPAGTAAVTVTFPASQGDAIDVRQAGAFVLYNAAQSAPDVVKSAGANATTNPVVTSVTTLSANSWIVDVISQGNPGTFAATQAGQVARWQQSCGAQTSSSAASTKELAAAGATSLGWSHTAARRYAHSLAVFAPAASAASLSAEADHAANVTTTAPASPTSSSSSTSLPGRP